MVPNVMDQFLNTKKELPVPNKLPPLPLEEPKEVKEVVLNQ